MMAYDDALRDIFGDIEADEQPPQAPASNTVSMALGPSATGEGGGSLSKEPAAASGDSSSDSDSSSTDSSSSSNSSRGEADHPEGRRLRKKAMPAQRSDKKVDDQSDDDSYASEPAPIRTQEDDSFIDREGDDEGLLREYDQQDQDFADERPGRRKKKGRKSRRPAGLVEEAEAMLKKSGGKRKREISDKERARIVGSLLREMRAAAQQDQQARAAGRPAIHKLKLLPTVKQCVANVQIQSDLLEGVQQDSHDNPTILTVFRDWLRPFPGASIPALQLREAIYEMVARLPVQLPHLNSSRIGEVLYALMSHKEETSKNRELLHQLIERFSREIFSKTSKYKGGISDSLEAQAELGLVSSRSPKFTAPGRDAAAGPALLDGATAGISDADLGRLLGDDIEAMIGTHRSQPAQPESKYRHARIPQPILFDFVKKAVSNLDALPNEESPKKKDTVGGKLQKRIVDVRRAANKKIERGVRMSIEGRGT